MPDPVEAYTVELRVEVQARGSEIETRAEDLARLAGGRVTTIWDEKWNEIGGDR